MLLKQLVVEKLGNLRDLNVGPMINILKQQKRNGSSGRRGYEGGATAVGQRFGGADRKQQANIDIGTTSEIVDGGPLKGGLTAIRKAYRANEETGVRAFAIYVDGEAVAFATFDQEALGGSSRTGLLAFDLQKFAPEILKRFELKKAAEKYEYTRDRMKQRPLSSYQEEQSRVWGKRTEDGKDVFETKVYQGKMVTTAQIKEFIEEILDLAKTQGSEVTFKLVLTDKAARKKRVDRYHAMTRDEVYSGIEALKTRLAKYKISKKPTAKDIQEFMQMAQRGIRVVQFGGRGYKTEAESRFGDDKISPTRLLKGDPFTMRYHSVDPGAYDSLDVMYSFDPNTGTLVPFRAEWSDSQLGKTQVAALEPNRFVRHEIGVKTLDKDSIIRAILTKVKDGNTSKATQMVAAARNAGHDYPEFAAIEKSIAAEEQKRNAA